MRLLAGACNTWLGADLQRENLARFSNGSLSVIDGAGHDVVDDQPVAASARIAAFLASSRQTGGE